MQNEMDSNHHYSTKCNSDGEAGIPEGGVVERREPMRGCLRDGPQPKIDTRPQMALRSLYSRARHSAFDSLGWAQGRWSYPPTPVLTGSLWWDSNPHFRLSQDRSLSVEIQRRPWKFSATGIGHEENKVGAVDQFLM